MIKVTRLNGKELLINPELMKFVESTPDTLIWFSDGDKLNVLETPDQLIKAILEYRRYIHQPILDDPRFNPRLADKD
jgi:flagellar protein FlbD